MADEKLTPSPASAPINDPSLDALLTPEAKPETKPAFKADDFLAGKKTQPSRSEAIKSTPPQVVKRGGIGFFTAFLMSGVAAGAGAYLALFAGSRPDLLQKAGIAKFVPQPPAAPSLGTNAGNIEPLVARVSAVEAELLALKSRLDSAGTAPAIPSPLSPATGNAPPTTAPTTALATPPSTALADVGVMKGELAGISGRLTALETRLAALDPTGAGGAIVAGLQADIAGLKSIVGTLQQQAATAPSPAVTFAVVNLAEAASRPGPFMVELDTLRAAMPNTPEVSALEPFARTGVPTRELLQERFAGLAPALAASQVAAKKEGGVLAWFKSLFAGMIKVQSAPNATGTAQTDVLARAKTKLDQGDLAGSLDEVASIPSAPVLVTEWVAAGRKRLELESRISAVRSAVGRAPILAAPILPPSAAIAPTAPTPLPAPPVPIAKSPPANPVSNQGKNP
jgi:hypothetical protein